MAGSDQSVSSGVSAVPCTCTPTVMVSILRCARTSSVGVSIGVAVQATRPRVMERSCP